tara:strand:+ start:1564 stop:2412 length:849 start_codon:yes stop_codon:yes gene_type:complete
MIKKLLKKHIVKNAPDNEIAVLLSGGVDSQSVALAAHDVGKTVIAYSFHLDGDESYDYLKAKEVSQYMGWKFKGIIVPKSNLVEDWHRLVKLKCRKKTHFECVFPFLYVYPEIKEKYVLTGWIADGYFQPGKTASMRYISFAKAKKYIKAYQDGKAPRVTWNQYRLNYIDGDCAGIKEHTRLAESHGKIHVTPYGDKRIRNYLMSMSWQQLNTPRQKEIVRKDFTKLEKFGTIKPHINLHLGSGVNKLFETLLNNNDINFKGRKRMMDVCRDWYEKNAVLPI